MQRKKSVPPLFICNVSVVVDVHVVEEAVELLVGDGQSGGFEGGLELGPVKFSVAILVNRPEEGRKLFIRAADKALELCSKLADGDPCRVCGFQGDAGVTLVLDLAVAVAVDLV